MRGRVYLGFAPQRKDNKLLSIYRNIKNLDDFRIWFPVYKGRLKKHLVR